jgi:hypothetical protein
MGRKQSTASILTALLIALFCAGSLLPRGAFAGGGQPTRNTADIVFQSMCSGGGTKGILDAAFPVHISWRCSKCGRKTQVTVPLVKTDNTDSIAKKLAGAINAAVAGSDNVRVTYYQSSRTKKQDQNWYRIRFTGVDQVDAGAWHSKLKLYVLTWPDVRYVRPGPFPENVTPGKPGRTLKPGKLLSGNRKKRKYAGPGFFGWKEVHFSIGLYPWSQPVDPAKPFVPYRSYRCRYAESDPDGLLFDQLADALVADGFEVQRFDDVELWILGGPDGTVATTLSLGTWLTDSDEENIDQEEHWTAGDIVASSDEEPVELTENEETLLQDEIRVGLNRDLSEFARDIALREGLVPWDEYPELLAQEPYDPEETDTNGSVPEMTVCIGEQCIPLAPDPDAPLSAQTFLGSTIVELELNFTGQLTAEVTASSPAGGDWTAWLDPDIVGPGPVTTTLWVRGEQVDYGALPAGSTNVQVAEITLFVVPF